MQTVMGVTRIGEQKASFNKTQIQKPRELRKPRMSHKDRKQSSNIKLKQSATKVNYISSENSRKENIKTYQRGGTGGEYGVASWGEERQTRREMELTAKKTSGRTKALYHQTNERMRNR